MHILVGQRTIEHPSVVFTITTMMAGYGCTSHAPLQTDTGKLARQVAVVIRPATLHAKRYAGEYRDVQMLQNALSPSPLVT